MIDDILIGADIEVFLQNKNTGEIVSAEGIIKGTKKEPFNFDKANKYYATSLDNVMAEFCIPPSPDPAGFYNGIQKALRYIESIIPSDLTPKAFPAAYLDEKYLQTENAKLFGCEPDYNAWNEQENLPPGTSTNLRTGGGHIHIGYKNPNPFINLMLVKAMDLYVGVPSILLEPDNERKMMYGKAGAFRNKDYGVEYRTISNYYLASKKLTDWIFTNTLKAIDFVKRGGCNMFTWTDKEEIVNTINYNDKLKAKELIEKYNIKLAE